ncbi:MAG: glycine cleavage system aminomethyltransferase GcvT [Porticoccaceae bacterium]
MSELDPALARTPLFNLHNRLGARMVPFAGYSMPVQYPSGIKNEHLHCRQAAGMFDVSHMGQLVIYGEGVTSALERLLPADLEALKINQQCYSFLTNPEGGIIDDLIITRWDQDCYFIVVNASRKSEDLAHLGSRLPQTIKINELKDRALIAVQGPKAANVVEQHWPESAEVSFMNGIHVRYMEEELFLTRSGYTGEDGFEISIPADLAEELAEKLLADESLQPTGLGARDSLRLEAGLCLYGHDLDEQTTPVEAGLTWAISPSRRPGGSKAGGFTGADRIMKQLDAGTERIRVGLDIAGRAPVREGAPIVNETGEEIGTVTSGGFGPSIEKPVAMAYVQSSYAHPGSQVSAIVREKPRQAKICKLPFIKPGYFRG